MRIIDDDKEVKTIKVKFPKLGRCDECNRVEVVRCQDCAVPHNKWTGCPMLNGLVTPPNFYCAMGERKK